MTPLELDYVKVGDSNSCHSEKTWTCRGQVGSVSPFSNRADRCIIRVLGLILACSVFSLLRINAVKLNCLAGREKGLSSNPRISCKLVLDFFAPMESVFPS